MMKIRTALQKDVDACFALDGMLTETRREAEQEGFIISGDQRVAYEGYRALGCFYVAEENDRIVGFAFALPPGSAHMDAVCEQKAGFQIERKEVWDTPKLGWMGKIAVHPEYMRRGIGNALYKKIFEEHPEWSFLTMTVHKPLKNLPAEKFHEGAGFELVGEAPLGDRNSLKKVECKVYFRRAKQ